MNDVPSLEALLEEQEQLELSNFNYDFVWKLGTSLYQAASKESLPIAIEIRHSEDVVFRVLLPGATIDNFDWTRRKAAVARRFHRSSLYMRVDAQTKGYDLNTRFRLSREDYVASGGGFPLMIRGSSLIGTVSVSGLPDVEDHRLITARLADMLPDQRAPDAVTTAFSKPAC